MIYYKLSYLLSILPNLLRKFNESSLFKIRIRRKAGLFAITTYFYFESFTYFLISLMVNPVPFAIYSKENFLDLRKRLAVSIFLVCILLLCYFLNFTFHIRTHNFLFIIQYHHNVHKLFFLI